MLQNQQPTRISPADGKESTLDHCAVSNDICSQFKLSIASDLHGIDHFPIFIQHNQIDARPTSRPRWKYEQADWTLYQQTIDSHISANNDMTIDELHNLILQAAKLSIPITKGFKSGKSVPWWSKDVQLAIKERRSALRKLKRSTCIPNNPFTPHLASIYRIANSKAKRAIQEAKASGWTSLAHSIKPSSTQINFMSGKNHPLPSL